jgi:cytoskeletal protein CcmA (bactofilin family)
MDTLDELRSKRRALPRTRIGRSIVIEGEFVCDEDVAVDGRVSGFLHVGGGSLTIGEPARVEGDVRAARVAVRGTVRGTISASERIELRASADVTADISATHVVVADGAQFTGRVDMGRRTIAAKVAQFKAGRAASSRS